MATNITGEFYERPYYAAREQSTPPAWFQHTSPTMPGTPPTYPGTLNSFERAEVERYLVNPTEAVLTSLTLPDAIAMANLYKTYYATPAYQAWLAADRNARIAQWRLFRADGVIDNKGAIPPSSDDTGAGGGTLPGSEVPPGFNVP